MKALAALTMFMFYSLSALANPITRADESWHDLGNIKLYPTTAASSYEWFYFDVQHAGGAQLGITFQGPNTFDITAADMVSGKGTLGHVGVLAQAYIPGVGALACYDQIVDANKLQYVESNGGSQWDLTIDGSNVHMTEKKGGLRDYQLSLNLTCMYQNQVIGTLTGQLTYKALLPGWKHNDGILFSTAGGQLYNSWIVAVPLAKVTGRYTFQLADASGKRISNTVIVAGDDGYHDHNQGNVPLSTGDEKWIWGRAASPSGKVVIYAHMWGKSQPDFAGDQFVPTPASDILYVNDGKKIVVDSDQVDFTFPGNAFAYQNPATGTDMMIAPQADFAAVNSVYSFEADFPQTTTASLPYYIRQQSVLKITDASGCVETADLVSEQIEFKSFFKMLGLPVTP